MKTTDLSQAEAIFRVALKRRIETASLYVDPDSPTADLAAKTPSRPMAVFSMMEKIRTALRNEVWAVADSFGWKTFVDGKQFSFRKNNLS